MKRAVALVLLFSALGGILTFIRVGRLWGGPSGPLPTDASLTAGFHAHENQLDTLAAKALADSQLIGAGHDPMLGRFSIYVRHTPRAARLLTDDEVRSTGRSDYRKLLDQTGFRNLSRAEDGKRIWFVVRVAHGVRKGVLYSKEPLKPERASLDSLEAAVRESFGAAYVPLAPGWYLFLESRAE